MTCDDITPRLNPVRAADLVAILRLSPARVRPAVAMAYAELNMKSWGEAAGLADGPNVYRWLHREVRLPFGAAYRLAAVLGVPMELLFAAFIE